MHLPRCEFEFEEIIIVSWKLTRYPSPSPPLFLAPHQNDSVLTFFIDILIGEITIQFPFPIGATMTISIRKRATELISTFFS